MDHKVIHFEIQGRDGKKSQEFYASLSDCASEQSGRALRFEAPAG